MFTGTLPATPIPSSQTGYSHGREWLVRDMIKIMYDLRYPYPAVYNDARDNNQ